MVDVDGGGFDEPVGVESEGGARRERVAGFGEPLTGDAEDDSAVVVEEVDVCVRVDEGGGQVAGVGDGDGGGRGLEDGVDAADQRAVGAGVDGSDEVVEVGQYVRGGQVEGGEGADRGTDLSHHGGGGQAPAHDVADDEGDPAGRQADDVEPVAADLGGGGARLVAPGEFQALDRGQVSGQQPALQGECGRVLVGVGAGVGDRAGDPAAELRRELYVVFGVGPAGGSDREDDHPVKRATGQQRHMDDGPQAYLPEVLTRTGDVEVTHELLAHLVQLWFTYGEYLVVGGLAGELDPLTDLQTGWWFREASHSCVHQAAQRQPVRPGGGVERFVGQQEDGFVGEFRDDEFDQPFQDC